MHVELNHELKLTASIFHSRRMQASLLRLFVRFLYINLSKILQVILAALMCHHLILRTCVGVCQTKQAQEITACAVYMACVVGTVWFHDDV